MVTQLLEKERIRTTLAKAKTLQRYADKVITLGKQVRQVRPPSQGRAQQRDDGLRVGSKKQDGALDGEWVGKACQARSAEGKDAHGP
jgi:hypothetical protein